MWDTMYGGGQNFAKEKVTHSGSVKVGIGRRVSLRESPAPTPESRAERIKARHSL